jgi:hypothetical protein
MENDIDRQRINWFQEGNDCDKKNYRRRCGDGNRLAHSYVLARSQKHILTPTQKGNEYMKKSRMWSNNDKRI